MAPHSCRTHEAVSAERPAGAFVLTHYDPELDPRNVAPKHHKVVRENDRVRVANITYAPHESAPMHSHPRAILGRLSEMRGKFTYPDSKTEEVVVPAGACVGLPAVVHAGEPLSDQHVEAFLVEIKL